LNWIVVAIAFWAEPAWWMSLVVSLPCCLPLLVLVIVMLSLFSLLFPQVIQLDRVRHRGLGGARMVDVTGCHVAVLALPLLSCWLLPVLVTSCGAAFSLSYPALRRWCWSL
jgi:hypothetical protein